MLLLFHIIAGASKDFGSYSELRVSGISHIFSSENIPSIKINKPDSLRQWKNLSCIYDAYMIMYLISYLIFHWNKSISLEYIK